MPDYIDLLEKVAFGLAAEFVAVIVATGDY